MRSVMALLLGGVFVLAGCASGPRTASGRPELVVSNLAPKEIRDRLVNAYAGSGWNVEKADEYNVVFAKLSDSALQSIFLGSQYDPNVYWRVRFTVTAFGNGARVYGFAETVSNYGSAFERRTDFSNAKAGCDVQETLEALFANSKPKEVTPDKK